MKVSMILSRVYVSALDTALPFYEELLGEKAAPRIRMPAIGLELARIRELLVIGGSEEALRPFRDTKATFVVDDLDAFRSHLLAHGGEVIRGPQDVPTGRNMSVRHADGSVIEYVQLRLQNPIDARPYHSWTTD